MTAKQTLLSASLALLVPTASALADPDEAGDPEPAEQAPPPPSAGKSGTFSVGAGYSSDDGFIATARVAQANLFGTGKQLSLTAFLTERQQLFLMRYDDPALFGSDTLRLRGDLYSQRKLFTGFEREATGGTLSLVQRIAPHLDVFVGYKLEHVAVTPTSDTTYYRASEPLWRGGLISALRVGVSYSTIAPKDRYYPMRGTTAGTSIERADRDLGSAINYTRTDAWLQHHQPIGPLTLHVGARASSISNDAPMSERLHFDGSSDVRGYAPDSLLPGGGNFLWSARAELEVPVVSQLSVAGFFDAGGLYRQGLGKEAASAGVGVIWRSPIGPLRFDYAIPLGGGEPRFLIGIGGMF